MEYTHSLITFALLVAALGLLSLSVPLLLLNSSNKLSRIPMVGFLVCSGVANSLPVFIEFYSPLELYGLAIWLPCYLLMPVCLWLYTQAITATTPWKFSRKHYKHLLPSGFGILVSISLFTLPSDLLDQIFRSDNSALPAWPQAVVICAFALMILWVFLSAYYVVRILSGLVRYRANLKMLFANNDKSELYWLSWTVTVLAGSWCLSLFYSIPLLTNQALILPIELMAIMHLALLWTLSVFGITQEPGYAGRYLNTTDLLPSSEDKSNLKYQKSGLTEQELARIASKIEAAMTNKKLYLDSGLSLQKLASAVQVSPNYVSQALNENLKKSFFDYVNSYRIQHAIPELLDAQKTVLDIAMDAGFNARSSFYKAFKKTTGLTPSEYKKNKQAGATDLPN